ncbi:hypothetical protein L211DRAFT_851267 [Terfezia boudieri ATCC MYA-4762]|uniref:Uncharacterized protein n=1 Tax=Terfezia boudieri ATCC MYA-4762 TaxID=1051890 RepID=A0A3N4LGF6_9PEZI|nr:hypothetical protein L211DRAFT_851267 [Terfezia boudieri ATCC MYA-4762]
MKGVWEDKKNKDVVIFCYRAFKASEAPDANYLVADDQELGDAMDVVIYEYRGDNGSSITLTITMTLSEMEDSDSINSLLSNEWDLEEDDAFIPISLQETSKAIWQLPIGHQVIELGIRQKVRIYTKTSRVDAFRIMAPPPKGVLFGSVKDWGKGVSKVLLEFDREDGVKKAIANSQEAKKSWSRGGSWEHHMSQLEKESREEEEIIKVVDRLSVERAIEILTRRVMIQDGAVNGLLEEFDFEYSQKEMEGGVEDTIVVKAKRPDGMTVEGF